MVVTNGTVDKDAFDPNDRDYDTVPWDPTQAQLCKRQHGKIPYPKKQTFYCDKTIIGSAFWFMTFKAMHICKLEVYGSALIELPLNANCVGKNEIYPCLLHAVCITEIGECRMKPDIRCASDSQCPPKTKCQSLRGCVGTAGAHCGQGGGEYKCNTGYQCLGGQCRITDGRGCSNDPKWCNPGSVCDSKKTCGKGVNEKCSKDSECTFGATCLNGRCQCQQYVTEVYKGVECRNTVSTYGITCYHNENCKSGQCLNNKCGCYTDQILSPKDSTCKNPPGTICTLHDGTCDIGLVCENNICKLDLGAECSSNCRSGLVCEKICKLDKDQDCVGKELMCKSKTKCLYGKCTPFNLPLRHECTYNESCKTGGCVKGCCKCMPDQQTDPSGTKCFNKPGHPCDAYGDICSELEGDWVCEDGICKIRTGIHCNYEDFCSRCESGSSCECEHPGNAICLAGEGGACDDDSDCAGTGTVCDQGTCNLNIGSRCKGKTFACKTGAVCEDGICKSDECQNCSTHPELCKSETKCLDGKCEPLGLPVTSPCKFNENCKSNRCIARKCACPVTQMYYAEDSTCRNKPGTDCNADGVTCSPEHICEDGICKIPAGDNCTDYEQHCQSRSKCDECICKWDLGETCSTKKYLCKSGTVCDNGICKKIVGETCSTQTDMCKSGTKCYKGKCIPINQPVNSDCTINENCKSHRCVGKKCACRLNQILSEHSTCNNLPGVVCTAGDSTCEERLDCEDDICKIPITETCTHYEQHCLTNLTCDTDTCKTDVGKDCKTRKLCKSGSVCDDGICKQEEGENCDSQNDLCKSGTKCYHGKCIPIDLPVLSPCEYTENCKSRKCINKNCACPDNQTLSKKDSICKNDPGIPCGTGCSDNLDCENGICKIPAGEDCKGLEKYCKKKLICEDEICYFDLGVSCRDDPQLCKPGYTCDAGICKLGEGQNCSTKNDLCKSGTKCFNGICIPITLPPGATCAINESCWSYRCIKMKCGCPKKQIWSAQDNICGNGPGTICRYRGATCHRKLICENNVCTTPLGVDCTKSNQCTKGTVCEDDVCKTDAGQDCSDNPGMCKDGAVCENGICKMKEHEDCTNKAMHCVSGTRCINRTCTTINLPATADCKINENCKSNRCAKKNKKCDCPLGQILYAPDSKCENNAGTECDEGGSICSQSKELVCHNNICEIPIGKPCKGHEEYCNGTLICDKETCKTDVDQDCSQHPEMCQSNSTCDEKSKTCKLKENQDCTHRERSCKSGFNCINKKCRPIDLPPLKDCTTNANCESNRCVNKTCACRIDQELLYQNNKYTCENNPGVECDAYGTKCKQGLVCVNNICKIPTGKVCKHYEKFCNGTSVCDKDKKCRTDVNEDCRTNKLWCKIGMVCDTETGKCLKEKNETCTTNKDFCKTGTICSDGRCWDVDLPPQQECRTDDNCNSSSCVDNKCVCRESQVLSPEHNICENNPGTNCNENGAKCHKGLICTDGTCKIPIAKNCTHYETFCNGTLVCDKDKKCKTPVGGGCRNKKESWCKEGTVCDDKTGICMSDVNEDCTTNKDLCKTGTECSDGKCWPVNLPPEQKCRTNQNCNSSKCANEKCVCRNNQVLSSKDNTCENNPGTGCNYNGAKCRDGYPCENNICKIPVAEVCTDYEIYCNGTLICDKDGKCKTDVGDDCKNKSASWCNSETKCDTKTVTCTIKENNNCTTNEAFCETGTICSNGKCWSTNLPPQAACRINENCKSNRCVNNVCLCRKTQIYSAKDKTCRNDAGEICNEGGGTGCAEELDCEDKNNVCKIPVKENCTGKERFCEGKLVCDIDKICKTPVGEDCRNKEESWCQKGTVCDKETGTCLKKENETCATKKDLCKSGTKCSDGKCWPTDLPPTSECRINDNCKSKKCKSKGAQSKACDCPDKQIWSVEVLTCTNLPGTNCHEGGTKCSPNLECDKKSKTCKIPIGVNCTDYQKECKTDLTCDTAREDIVCTTDLLKNCTTHPHMCKTGMVCDNGVCKKKENEKCTGKIQACKSRTKCSGGKCIPIDQPINSKCNVNINCKSQRCMKNNCECPENQVFYARESICTNTPGSICDHGGTKCSPKLICFDNICKIPLGGNCTGDENNCNSTLKCESGTCKLKTGKSCTNMSTMCQGGDECVDGICVDRNDTVGSRCTANNQCQTNTCDKKQCACRKGQELWVKNTCRNKPGTPCNAYGSTCSPRLVCQDNICKIPEEQPCVNYEQFCVSKTICDAGICRLETYEKCKTKFICKSKTMCDGDICVPTGYPIDSMCGTANMCMSGVCLNGICVCDKYQHRSHDLFCRNKAGTNCTYNGDICLQELVCDNHVCKLTDEANCTGNELFCKSGLICYNGVCKGKVGADCLSKPSMCRPGTICADGICKIIDGADCTNKTQLCKSKFCSERDNSTCRYEVKNPCTAGTAIYCRNGTYCEDDKICKSVTGENCTSSSQCEKRTSCKTRDSSTADSKCRGPLKYPCETDEDCEQGAICDKILKECRLAKYQGCSDYPELCLSGSLCVNDQCLCNEQLTDTTTEKCDANTSVVGGPCSTEEKCQVQGAACIDNTCECERTFVVNPQTLECVLDLGSSCSEGSLVNCTEEGFCDPSGICALNVTDICEGENSVHCQVGAICDTDGICRYNRDENCTDIPEGCRNGTTCDILKRCKNPAGAECGIDFQCEAGSHCDQETQECQCTEGVSVEKGGICEPIDGKVGGKCKGKDCTDPASECNPDTGLCECMEGYVGEPLTLSCAKTAGKPCAKNKDCAGDLLCDPEDHICKIPLGDACEENNEEFCEAGSECDIDRTCKLPAGGNCSLENGFCISGFYCDWLEACTGGVGDKCSPTEAHSCPSGSVCKDTCTAGTPNCAEFMCACDNEVSTQSGPICEPRKGRYGASCIVSCTVKHSECVEGICRCVAGATPNIRFNCVVPSFSLGSNEGLWTLLMVILSISGIAAFIGAGLFARRKYHKRKRDDVLSKRTDNLQALRRMSKSVRSSSFHDPISSMLSSGPTTPFYRQSWGSTSGPTSSMSRHSRQSWGSSSGPTTSMSRHSRADSASRADSHASSARSSHPSTVASNASSAYSQASEAEPEYRPVGEPWYNI